MVLEAEAERAETALERAKEALRLLVRGGRVERVPRVLSRIIKALREKGYDAEADQLEREVAQTLGEVGLSLDEVKQRVPQVTEKRGILRPGSGQALPARCGGCGAPLIPDEVEWHNAHTAECPYCGTIAKAT